MFLDYSKTSIIKLNKNMIKTNMILSELLMYNYKIESTNIPVEIQRILASNTHHDTDYVGRNLAKNKRLHKDIQILLANHNDIYVRIFLSLNPKIHNDTQLILANDKDFRIVRALAQNKNISIEAQKILAKYMAQDSMLAFYINENPNVSPEIKSRKN